MPAIVTICLVLTTVSLVALAIVTIRTMLRFERMAEQIETTAQMFCESMTEVRSATRDMHDLVASLDTAVHPVREAAQALGDVGNRAARLSTAVMDELETPLLAAIGIYRGIRAGVGALASRVSDRWRDRGDGSTNSER